MAERFATLQPQRSDNILDKLGKMLETLLGGTGNDGSGGGVIINPGGVGGVVLAPWQHDNPSTAQVNHSGPGGGFLTLGSITGINLGPDQYIMLFDTDAYPPNPANPVAIIKVFGGTTFFFDYGTAGLKFTSGILACNSTTAPTFTAGAANCWFSFAVRP